MAEESRTQSAVGEPQPAAAPAPAPAQPAPAAAPAQPAASRGPVYAMFAVVVLGAALGNLSQTAVNAIINDIMPQFGMSVEVGQWLTTLYMLMLGVTVPAVTFITKRFSVRQHTIAAFAIFALGAFIDLVAPTFWLLLVGRVLQAIAAGMLLPLLQTIAMMNFPPGKQATAMGIAGIALGFAPNVGPTVGSLMSSAWGWRSLFLLLMVVALVLGVAAAAAIRPAEPLDRTATLDLWSVVLSALGFGGLLLGFSNASSYAITSPFIWLPILVGAVFLVCFVLRQKRIERPLVSMDIFRSSQYIHGFVAQNLLNISYMGITLVLPLYVEDLCGGTTVQAGMALLPSTVMALIVNPLAGTLADRVGTRKVVVVTACFLAVGATCMAFMDASTPMWMVMLFQGIRAVGVSGLISPLASWTLEKLPKRIVADGSSFSTAVRQACASFGTSLMVFAITAVGATALGAAHPALAYQTAFGTSAVFAIATLVYCVAKVR